MIADKPVSVPEINPTLIESGMVYVEVFPMKSEEHGSRLTELQEEPDYYDIMLRPDDFPSNMNQPFAEWEYLSLDEAGDLVDLIVEIYPNITISWL